jgi:hypothetical protein
MFEYKIALDYKIVDCIDCPFRRELMFRESVISADKLTGVIGVDRRDSHCVLRKEQIVFNQQVDGYNSQCPLKGKAVLLPDETKAQ